MPLSRCPRILTVSLLCIAGLLIVPLLINLISSDLFSILQSHLSLRARLLILTMIVTLCFVPLVIEVNYHKEKDKNKTLLPQTNCCAEPKVHGRATGFKVRRRPRPRNADADAIRDFLSSLRDDEGLRIVSPVHGALTVHTQQEVRDVEAALKFDHTKCGSKIVHKMYELGPQSGHDTLDIFSSQIEEAMRHARELDQNCTFQFGSFALFKYKDGELKCWRLQEDWTPKITDIRRSPWNIVDFFTGQGPTWIIRGSNLQNATLRASTSNEKEKITILHCHKMEGGEDVLLCAEPGLIRRSLLKFWKGVHICALKSVRDTKEGSDFDLQSESKDAKIPYCFSVVKGFIPSPGTMMITMAYLLLLGTLGCVTHGTHGGMCFRLGAYYLGLQKIMTIFGATSEILTVSASMLHVLCFIIVFLILAYWCFTAKQVPPFDDNFSVIVESPPAMVEYESNGTREIVGESGDDVLGPPRTIPPKSYGKTSCSRSPLFDEETMNIEEKGEATEETEKVKIGEEEQWLAEHKQEEGDSMPSLHMCVPFEDLSNPGNATSLLPEEDESMDINLNNDEKQKEEGEALLRMMSKSEDFFNLRASPPAVPDNESIEQTENSGESDEIIRPRPRNADADAIRDFLSSLRKDEGLRIVSPVHGALTVHTDQQVRDVEAAVKFDHTKCGSKIVHKMYELGPQSGHDTLDIFSSQIEEAMRHARELDQNCTFQFGSFALFKYKDGELKCWRLQEDWTPKITDIRRSPWNIVDFFTGQGPTWIIRGSNLQNATLRASTSNEKEKITILHCHKVEGAEDVLLCAEPGLIRRSLLKFWKGVHICALKSVKDTKEGSDFDLQSESKDAKIPYCFSVVKGFIPSPGTMMITMAYLVLLGTLGCVTHGTHGGMCFRLGAYYLGLQKIMTIFGATSEILTVSASMLHLLFFIIVFPILAYWCFTAKHVPPLDDNFSVIVESPPAMVEYESNGTREIVGEPGNDVLGPPRTIPPKSYGKTSCSRSPLFDEETMNIEEKEEATEETEKVTIGEEEQWLAEHKQEEGDSMPSLHMCIPFEDLSNPGNATSLLPEEDESMNSNLNNDEKQKEEGKALLRTLSKSEDLFNLRTSPPAVPHDESIEQTENSGESDEIVSGVAAVTTAVADSEDNFSVRETPPTMVENELHGNPDSINVPPPGQIYSIHPKISSPTSTGAQQQQLVVDRHRHSGSPAGPSQQLRVTILGEEGTLAGLVKLLFKDDNPNLQKHAGVTLLNLASEEELPKLNIVNEEGAIAGLVKLLFKDDNPDLQKVAAAALQNLANGPVLPRQKLLGEEGALAGLVKLLFKDGNPNLQNHAARALQNLASEEELGKIKIVNEEGAIAGLVKLLFKEDNPDLQKVAAAALQNLANGPVLLRQEVLEEEGALVGLVKLLFKDDNPNLQKHAAGALQNLASEEELAKLKIVNEEGAIAGLVKLLFKDDNPDLQKVAAAALQNLANGPVLLRQEVLEEEGALVGLVKLLFKDDNPNLQKHAAGALQNLASEEELAKLKIVNEEGAIAGLVKLLFKDDNPDLQKVAAAALQNLANGPVLLRQKVLGEEGALAGLVKLLRFKDENQDLQKLAAMALQNLESKEVLETLAEEFKAVADLVQKGTDFARYLTDTWYKSNQAMEQFPRKLKTLQLKMDLWSTLLQRYGMSEDMGKLLGMLHTAKKVLDEETSKLQQLRTSSTRTTRWRHKVKQNLLNFPSDLTATLQSIIDGLDQTYELLKMEGEAPNVLRLARRHWPEKLRFGHDSKYVPLTESVNAVRQALENAEPQRRNVVFLLGVGGSGKTSLVKGLALLYKELESNPSSQFSDGVFFLHCGRGADSLSKLRELVHRMGFPLPMPKDDEVQESEAALMSESSTPFQPSSSSGMSSTVPSKSSRSSRENLDYLQKELSSFLERQNLLIVLDDVWEAEFLEDILVSNANHVKYLITTQCPGLWANALTVEMTKPSKQDARKILANHAEVNGDIPPHLQDVADEIIESSDSNPSVLASLTWSMVAHRRSFLQEQEWRSTLSDLSNLIEREDDAPFAFDVKYPRSVSSSIMMAFDSLPRGAQTLLCLISALCESPVVPEIVLELLFSKLRQTPHVKQGDSFLYCTRMLEARALIVRQDQTAGWNLVVEQNLRTCTIHDLQQMVIRSSMQDAIDEIFLFLLAHCSTSTSSTPLIDNDGLLSAAVIFIFGDQKFSEEAGGKLGTKMPRNTLMKTALEPLIWLLQPNDEQKKLAKVNNRTLTLELNGKTSLSRRYSTSASTGQHISAVNRALKKANHAQPSADLPFDQHECARRALLQYVCHGQLDDTGISGLLASSDLEIAAAACEALRTIAETHEPANLETDQPDELVPLLQTQAEGIVQNLLKLAQMTTNPSIQTRALEALGANHEVVMHANDPSTLQTLVALLEPDVTNQIKVSVGTALLRLADSEEAKERILTFPKLFEWLLEPKLQFHVTRILSILSVTRGDTKKVLVETPGALDRLLSLMCNDDGNSNQTVPQQAAVCITNLTIPRNNQLTKATIVRVSASLSSLLSSNCVSLEIKQYVAKSWANLAAVGGDENKRIMLGMEGALPNMINLLKSEMNTVVQEQIVFALENRAMETYQRLFYSIVENLAMEHKNKTKIASVPSTLSLLVNLMSPASSVGVQRQVASLLALLATAHMNKILVASTRGLLEHSVRMMASDKTNLQRQAARLVGNLTVYNFQSSGTKEGRQTILRFEGILEGLVKLLGLNVDQSVQKQAARSIGHLGNDKISSVSHENKELIAALEGRMTNTVDSMEPGVRFEAARTLGYLVFRSESNGLKVAETVGAVEALVHALDCMSHLNLQEQAAWALVHLAISRQNRKTLAAAGAIERLQNLLRDPKVNSMVQRRAARALTLINHEECCSVHLQTGQAHIGRGRALLELSMHKEALQDFQVAAQIFQLGDEGLDREKRSMKQRAVLCQYQCFAKAMLKDYQGASQDADIAVQLEPKNIQRWHERGALKAMIGQDLEGALEDLNKGDHLVTSDDCDAMIGDYHRLKYRGLVKMKSGDETGAYADASCAQRMNSRPGPVFDGALGAASLLELPLAYLDFQLP